MQYCRNDYKQVIQRQAQFFSAQEPGHFLIQTTVPLFENNVSTNLEQWNFDTTGVRDKVIEDLKRFATLCRIKETIEDDRLSSFSPRYGIAEMSAFVSDEIEVSFSANTSWHESFIKEWSDLRQCTPSDTSRWLSRLIEGWKHAQTLSEGNILLGTRGTLGPMDLANALRGNTLLYDFMDYHSQVHDLLQFCAEVVICYMQKQHAIIGAIRQGTYVPSFGVWHPGRICAHLSNDLSSMCSRDIYDEFGFPYEQQVINAFDGAMLHIHALGMHVLPRLLMLKGLKLIELTEDPNCVHPFDQINRIVSYNCQKIPLMFQCTPEDIYSKIGELCKMGNFILVVHCNDVKQAKEVIVYVRNVSKPL